MADVDSAFRADRRLLLLSNSRDVEGRYLVHARDALARRLDGVREAVFVPYAGVTTSWIDYTARAAAALTPLGIALRGVHAGADPAAVVRDAEALVVGGGNTFHLLAQLERHALLGAIRARVAGGMPYVGWSAGAVVAGPTIRTTNDMPIVEPAGFDALGLVGFQLNAHYTELHPPGFQGETRAQRLAEFVIANPGVPVLGLPEGSWLEVDGPRVVLGGPHAAPVFRRDAGQDIGEEMSAADVPVARLAPGTEMGALLERAA